MLSCWQRIRPEASDPAQLPRNTPMQNLPMGILIRTHRHRIIALAKHSLLFRKV